MVVVVQGAVIFIVGDGVAIDVADGIDFCGARINGVEVMQRATDVRVGRSEIVVLHWNPTPHSLSLSSGCEAEEREISGTHSSKTGKRKRVQRLYRLRARAKRVCVFH